MDRLSEIVRRTVFHNPPKSWGWSWSGTQPVDNSVVSSEP
jgi:hypothetical protein